MNITDLLGAVMQSGMTSSSKDRLRNAMGSGGGGNLLESLAGMLGGPSTLGDGLGERFSAMRWGGIRIRRPGRDARGRAERAGTEVGGNQNLALGGLGALAGALLGGGGKSLGGALGGGVMALLGTMAYQALKGAGGHSPEVPLGLPLSRSPRPSGSNWSNMQRSC